MLLVLPLLDLHPHASVLPVALSLIAFSSLAFSPLATPAWTPSPSAAANLSSSSPAAFEASRAPPAYPVRAHKRWPRMVELFITMFYPRRAQGRLYLHLTKAARRMEATSRGVVGWEVGNWGEYEPRGFSLAVRFKDMTALDDNRELIRDMLAEGLEQELFLETPEVSLARGRGLFALWDYEVGD
ncbi:hypothetical protein VTJ49DRAFT_3593 [Mycothermus thermophilus]|uniref:Uncharacterized protein n=1 Tax=Humicola insolens TaxID=85995 RepID=A0ABR3VM74_HUMIN